MISRDRRILSGSWWLLLAGVVGCQRSDVTQFTPSQAAQKLSAELQQAVHEELEQRTGDFRQPKMLAHADEKHGDPIRGQAVYQERCVQCHGVSGDGDGPSAKYMYPRPRDYRKGIFKFTSTPYGYHPLRSDLVRTVRMGVRGTSMPSFGLLPDEELESVVDYVVMLARRGEFEEQLVALAESEESVDANVVHDELAPSVLNLWRMGEAAEVSPLTPRPRFTSEHVERGRKAFLTKGCSKCHDQDGRGQALENLAMKDVWGFPTRAADLTSGMLHGGNRPLDVYRRIYSGVNGTPMPSSAAALANEPDTLWDLVAFVLSISNTRRAGAIPAPGAIHPYGRAPAAAEEAPRPTLESE